MLYWRRRRVPTDDSAQRRKQATQQRSSAANLGGSEPWKKAASARRDPFAGCWSLQVPAYGPPLGCRKRPSAAGDETKRSSNAAAGAAPSHCDTSLTPFGFGTEKRPGHDRRASSGLIALIDDNLGIISHSPFLSGCQTAPTVRLTRTRFARFALAHSCCNTPISVSQPRSGRQTAVVFPRLSFFGF